MGTFKIPVQKLKIEYEDDQGRKLTLEHDNISGITHTELRQEFINFLRGIGYYIESEEDLV